MNLYNQLEIAHKEFFEHVYEDIAFYLKDKHGKSYNDILEHLKMKYTFYNFEEDKFNLIKNVQQILVNKIVILLHHIIIMIKIIIRMIYVI